MMHHSNGRRPYKIGSSASSELLSLRSGTPLFDISRNAHTPENNLWIRRRVQPAGPLLARLPLSVVTLNLSNNSLSEIATLLKTGNLRNITSVYLNECNIHHGKEIASVLSLLPPYLNTLYLSNSPLGDHLNEIAVSSFHSLPQTLHTLNLRNTRLHTLSVENLVVLFQGLPKLTVLDLSENNFGMFTPDELVTIFGAIPQVEILILQNCFSGDNASIASADTLKIQKVLKVMGSTTHTIDLGFHTFSSAQCLSEICAVLSPRISTLRLPGSHLSTIDSESLAQAFKYLKWITHLDISNNQLESLTPIAQLPRVMHLNLSGNAFSGSVLQDLTKFLPSSIEEVNWSNNKIIPSTLKALPSTVKKLILRNILGRRTLAWETLFLALPPTVEELDLSENDLWGHVIIPRTMDEFFSQPLAGPSEVYTRVPFDKLPCSLKVLRLCGNELARNPHFYEDVNKIPETLQSLDLGNNCFNRLTEDAFIKLSARLVQRVGSSINLENNSLFVDKTLTEAKRFYQTLQTIPQKEEHTLPQKRTIMLKRNGFNPTEQIMPLFLVKCIQGMQEKSGPHNYFLDGLVVQTIVSFLLPCTAKTYLSKNINHLASHLSHFDYLDGLLAHKGISELVRYHHVLEKLSTECEDILKIAEHKKMPMLFQIFIQIESLKPHATLPGQLEDLKSTILSWYSETCLFQKDELFARINNSMARFDAFFTVDSESFAEIESACKQVRLILSSLLEREVDPIEALQTPSHDYGLPFFRSNKENEESNVFPPTHSTEQEMRTPPMRYTRFPGTLGTPE